MLGIITARGGSKRVPRKNVKDFLGKPLLAWTVETGIESKVFDKFILTTDDEEIAEVGRAAGVEVPFMRPAELAADTSSSLDAIKHAVVWLKENQGYESEWMILLEPSAPGRQASHIREVAGIAEQDTNKHFSSIIGISETPGHFSPHKALIMHPDGVVTRTDGVAVRDLTHRNQDVAKTYFINSTIYAFRTENLFDKEKPSLWGPKTAGYLMDSRYAIDIDTHEDWLVAEVKMKELMKNK
jgi:CMP-N,N'-diacetyllegionaminic acid synthase